MVKYPNVRSGYQILSSDGYVHTFLRDYRLYIFKRRQYCIAMSYNAFAPQEGQNLNCQSWILIFVLSKYPKLSSLSETELPVLDSYFRLLKNLNLSLRIGERKTYK